MIQAVLVGNAGALLTRLAEGQNMHDWADSSVTYAEYRAYRPRKVARNWAAPSRMQESQMRTLIGG